MVAKATVTAQTDARARRRRWWALVLLCAAFSMVILDSTIVYVALPSIQRALGFSAAGVQWVVTVYLLTFAGLLLLGGRTADLVGRRTVFIAGLAGFTVASLGCALAPSAGVLIAARVVQAATAAMLTPAALALLITTFTEEAERNRALGIWGAIGGVGATAGLLVGGPVTDGLGWEWIFLINVPVGLVLLAASPVLLRESRDQTRPRAYDPAGAATVTLGLIVLVYAIANAPVVGWVGARTIGLLLAAAALVGLFVLVESRAPVPLVRLGIFRSPVLAGGNLLILTAGMTVDAVLFTLTLYTQEVLDYSAVQFGLMMAAMTALSVVGSYAGQALVTTRGVRSVAVAGTALVGVACLLLTRISVHASFLADLLPALLLFGLGLGGAFVAANVAALAGVAEQESGLASGVANTSFHIGGALGVAVASTVAASNADAMLVKPGHALLSAQELVTGYRSAFVAAAAIAGVALLAALTLLRTHHAVPHDSSERGQAMLKDSEVSTRLPVQDLARARAFYAEKLGLEPVEERPGGLRYQCGSGRFSLFESAGAASGTHTQMAWEVDDIVAVVAELRRRGVVFEEVDVPGLRTVDGIAEVAGNYPSAGVGELAAWFRDSESNLFGLGQALR